MKIVNMTPHSINIISKESCTFNSSIRKWVSENPVVTNSIPSAGMLNAKLESVPTDNIDGIPCFEKKIVGCDDIPEVDVIIVSALFFSAARACNKDVCRLYTVADPVYSLDGTKILGSLGICRGF